jgi:uncharacterized protein
LVPLPRFWPPVSLCLGSVFHVRVKPAHRFFYKVFALWLDVDRLPEAHQKSVLFSVNRFNVLSFFEKDHVPSKPETTLRARLNHVLAPLSLPKNHIFMLCYPRVFGFVFNPITTYFVFNTDQHLIAMVYEVRNTFGGHHTYVSAVNPPSTCARHSHNKELYVSPFLPQNLRYDFFVRATQNHVNVRILERDLERDSQSAPHNSLVLSALFQGTLQPLTTGLILKTLVKIPFLTLKVIGGIHFEALKLWRKGLKMQPDYKASKPITYSKKDA